MFIKYTVLPIVLQKLWGQVVQTQKKFKQKKGTNVVPLFFSIKLNLN